MFAAAAAAAHQCKTKSSPLISARVASRPESWLTSSKKTPLCGEKTTRLPSISRSFCLLCRRRVINVIVNGVSEGVAFSRCRRAAAAAAVTWQPTKAAAGRRRRRKLRQRGDRGKSAEIRERAAATSPRALIISVAEHNAPWLIRSLSLSPRDAQSFPPVAAAAASSAAATAI